MCCYLWFVSDAQDPCFCCCCFWSDFTSAAFNPNFCFYCCFWSYLCSFCCFWSYFAFEAINPILLTLLLWSYFTSAAFNPIMLLLLPLLIRWSCSFLFLAHYVCRRNPSCEASASLSTWIRSADSGINRWSGSVLMFLLQLIGQLEDLWHCYLDFCFWSNRPIPQNRS